MPSNYFYTYTGEHADKVILTPENCEEFSGSVYFTRGEAAAFLKSVDLPLTEKITCLNSLDDLSEEQQVVALVRLRMKAVGYNPDQLTEMFQGNWREFALARFTEVFGFTVWQTLTMSQESFLAHMDWESLQRARETRLATLIPATFPYAGKEWIVPLCYEF